MTPRRIERVQVSPAVLKPTDAPVPSNPSHLPWRITVRLDKDRWEYYHCSTRRSALHVMPLLHEQGKTVTALGQWDRWTRDYVSARRIE